MPGIGNKGAQRIVLELAGRLGSPGDGAAVIPIGANGAGLAGAGPLTWRDQVRTGLVNLGWQPRDADQAIAEVEPELLAGFADGGEGGQVVADVDVAVALRAALRVLGRR